LIPQKLFSSGFYLYALFQVTMITYKLYLVLCNYHKSDNFEIRRKVILE